MSELAAGSSSDPLSKPDMYEAISPRRSPSCSTPTFLSTKREMREPEVTRRAHLLPTAGGRGGSPLTDICFSQESDWMKHGISRLLTAIGRTVLFFLASGLYGQINDWIHPWGQTH